MNPSARTSLFAGAVLIVALAATVRSPAPPIEPPLELPPVVEPPDVPIRVADLRTVADPRPDPVPFTLAGRERRVSAASLVVDHLDNAGGRGRLTLDERPHTFNEYGDGTPTAGPPPTEYAVRFGRPQFDGLGLLCDVTFDGAVCPDVLKLYLAPEPADEHRLVRLVADAKPNHPMNLPASYWDWSATDQINPVWMLSLRPASLPPDPLPPVANVGRQGLSALVRNHSVDDKSRAPDPQRIGITGKPPGHGTLTLDPNRLGFGRGGRVVGATQLDFPEIRIHFRQLGPDPLGRGRQAFSLDPADKESRERYERVSGRVGGIRRYTLVLTAEDLGPHRLIVRDGDRITQVVPLTDVGREQRMQPLYIRSVLSPDERAAVDRLPLSGDPWALVVRRRRVWSITLTGDISRSGANLAALPSLSSLSVRSGRLGRDGIPGLDRLPRLTGLYFQGDITDVGVAQLLTAPQLQGVSLFATSGLTAVGLRPLPRLPRLTHLVVELPPESAEGDAALAVLSKASGLLQLTSSNGRPTDAGLTAVRRLRRLTVLTLWNADRVTPAGLWALDGLPDLRQVYLFGADLPADAVKAFTARNPRVQVFTKPFR